MLYEVMEERIEAMERACDELPYILANNGWSDEAKKLLEKMQMLSVILDDPDEDAEEEIEEIFDSIAEEPFEEAPEPKQSVGIYVVDNGRVLCGTRAVPDGFGTLGGPGGYVEEGESFEEAALRETKEEFGIEPLELIAFGEGEIDHNGAKPKLFLCVEYNGEPKCSGNEMCAPMWRPIDYYDRVSDKLYAPFKGGLGVLKDVLQSVYEEDIANNEESPYNGFVDRDDEEDVEWITVNGNHIPVDEDTHKPVGGQKKAIGEDKGKQGASPTITPALRKALKSERNQAIFFSRCAQYDENGNMIKRSTEFASDYAKANNGVTMGTLLVDDASELPEWDFTDVASVRSWEDASRVYAEQASGDVRVLIKPPLRKGNIFETVELPTLKNNPNITSVTMINIDTNEKTVLFRR